MHKPLILKRATAKGIVVFIHGFMGSPRQFDKLTKFVHSLGYSVSVLLLPGHGAGAKDFSTGTAELWQSHVFAEIERYSRDYDSIFLVGHSMGCLLAICAAAKYPERIRGLLLLACPFRLIRLSAHSFKVRLAQVFYRKSHPMKAAYLSGNSVSPSISLIWHSKKPLDELKKLMLTAKDNLPAVKAPVISVYSSADELVSAGSLDILKAGLANAPHECISLSVSLHSYYPKHEQDVIEDALMRIVGAEK